MSRGCTLKPHDFKWHKFRERFECRRCVKVLKKTESEGIGASHHTGVSVVKAPSLPYD